MLGDFLRHWLRGPDFWAVALSLLALAIWAHFAFPGEKKQAEDDAAIAEAKAKKAKAEAEVAAAKQKERFAASDVPLDILNTAELEKLQAAIQMKLSEAEYRQKTEFDEHQAQKKEKWAKRRAKTEIDIDVLRSQHEERKAQRRRKSQTSEATEE